MGGNKRSKDSKRREKSPPKTKGQNKKRSTPRTGEKRPIEPTKSDESNRDLDSKASPKTKNPKLVQVTVHNTENKGDKTSTEVRKVSVQSDEEISQDSFVDKRKTRSSGDLTEVELNAQLPIVGKRRNTTEKTNTTGLAQQNVINAQNNHIGKAIPVKVINPSNAGNEEIQIQVREGDRELTQDLNENENRTRESSSERDTSSDSPSTSTSSSSDENGHYQYRSRKPKKRRSRAKKRRRVSTSPSSSESEDEDSYHQRLLRQNPGLIDFIERKSTKGGKKGRPLKSHKGRKHGKYHSHKSDVVNSPSVDTIYVPVLDKVPSREGTPVDREAAIEKGIRRIRLQNFSPSVSSGSEGSTAEERRRDERDKQIHEAAEKIIIDSERQKATLSKPPEGNDSNIIDKALLANYDYDNDGNFLTSTCHIDESMTDKVALGKCVELEKLLNKRMKDLKQGSEQKMQLINKDGSCYWGPVHETDNKITGIRKWEEAFKVYMMIYSKANPTRASEILSYADIITGAAQTFTWENVSNYDFYFHKLMEQHPNHSWARTHTQLWTLMMKDHLPSKSKMAGGPSRKDWRESSCWRYNRGKCTRSADECKFEHRCSSCGSYNHIALSCYKKKQDKRGGECHDRKKSSKHDKSDKHEKPERDSGDDK